MLQIRFKTKEKPLTTRVRGKRLRHFISVSIHKRGMGLDYYCAVLSAVTLIHVLSAFKA